MSHIENDSNLFSIQKAFYEDPDNAPSTTIDNDGEEGQDAFFKRWEHFMAPRVNKYGNPIAPDIIYKEWAKYQASQPLNKKANKNGNWSYLGPDTVPFALPLQGSGGTGRINCLRFTPGNPQVMWAGTGSGGLWKSTDGGNSWTTNTDNIPNLGVTDVAINPRNTDTMFMATGDGYAYSTPNGRFFGGEYSNGVMRSVDGGNTWDTTSLNWGLYQVRQIYRLMIYPEDPNIVIALTNSGIWKTKDGGNTWKNVLSTKCCDMQMNRKHHEIMYAGFTSFYTTKDTGSTWQKISITYPVAPAAMTIATSAANDSAIYLLLLNGFSRSTNTILIRSMNGGKTWATMSNVNITTFQGYYDAAINVSPIDANVVSVGGLDVYQSSNGGQSWTQITYNQNYNMPSYTHPDHRVFEYYPGSADTVFDGNDGGLFRSVDGGSNWQIISKDIHALELYRIGSGSADPSILYTGAQDNGVNQLENGAWTLVVGGDGMTCQVAWDDPTVAYGCYQYGEVKKTVDGGKSFVYLYPPDAGKANWTAPLVIDPVNSSTLYYGSNKLYQSTDGGNTWNSISDPTNNPTNVSAIGISPSDANFIYCNFGTDFAAPSVPQLFRTKDGGTTWTNIGKQLKKVSSYLSDIAVDRRDANHVAIGFSAYDPNAKVYISSDAGTTFTNISAGLPNIPVNCLIFEGSVENGLFIGTDVGVFYRNDNTNGWIPYNTGLPNVMVNQLEVFPALNKIRAATFGRGVWDGVLTGTISGIEKAADLSIEVKIYPNPSTSGQFSLDFPANKYSKPNITVYNMTGQKMQFDQNIIASANGLNGSLDLSGLADGIYTVNFNYPDAVVSKKLQVVK